MSVTFDHELRISHQSNSPEGGTRAAGGVSRRTESVGPPSPEGDTTSLAIRDASYCVALRAGVFSISDPWPDGHGSSCSALRAEFHLALGGNPQDLKRRCRSKKHAAFTMVEILAVVAIIGVLVGLLLPAIQASREGARRMSCSSNLSQVGLAVMGYHNAFNQFPVQLSGTDGSPIAGQDNDRRLSIFVALLPFLDDRNLADQIAQAQVKGAIHPDGDFQDAMSMDGALEMGSVFESDETIVDEADQDIANAVERWPAGGPEPFQNDYAFWYHAVPVLRCPSDPGVGQPSMGRSNYAVCLGDGLVASSTGPMKEVNGMFVVDKQRAINTKIAMRGIFIPRLVTHYSDVTDGLSQTILLGEICTDLGDEDIRTDPVIASLMAVPNLLRDQPLLASQRDCIDTERPRFWDMGAPGITPEPTASGLSDARRGYRWADGMPLFTGFNTILPPNREIALTLDQEDSDGVLPPSSRHQGGVHLCLADGAVRFVTDSIDAGDSNQPTVYPGSYPEATADNELAMRSPYGVWGAMGTRASTELVAGNSEVVE